MSSPDPEGMSLLGKALAAGAAVVAPLWGGWKYMDARFEKKADKSSVKESFDKLDEEITMQRKNIGKIFDQIRDSDQRAQDRHERLLERLK